MNRAQWHRRASTLVLFWLAAAVIPPLVHRNVPAAGWLMVHVLLLGAVTNALLIWSQHFTYALLRRPEPPRRTAETARLATANAAILTVVVAMLAGRPVFVGLGATLIAVAVGWHALALTRLLRRALPNRFSVTVRYYIAASGMLVLAVGLGTALANGGEADGLLVAHATVALLGWLGMGILGTLVTLWPTMLHSRIVDGAERAARQALPLLIAGVLLAAAGLIGGIRAAALLGLGVYAVAAGWLLRPTALAMRQRGPRTFPSLSTACGMVWLAVALSLAMARVALAPDLGAVVAGGGVISAAAVIGIAQVLLGALTHLTPVVAGGGPAALRTRMDRAQRWGPGRLVVTNAGLLLCLLPVPSAVRVTASVAVLVALALGAATVASSLWPVTVEAAPHAQTARFSGGVVAGLAVVVLAVVAGVAADPAALGSTAAAGRPGAAGVIATGRTTTVDVRVEGMRFSPAAITVPAGDRLVIVVHNTGEDTHDLVLDTGERTARLRPGESATLDAGVIGRAIEGWCSVAGHRQMGMVLAISVAGQDAAPPADHTGHVAAPTGATAMPDLMAEPPPDFRARDATLPAAAGRRVHRVRLVATEVTADVAPGVTQTRWTYNGTAPGPTLRGRVGDRFIVTLVNDGTIGHSIDFHAGALAPDGPMRTIQPGEALVYRFTARRAGIWMYHCSTMPMSMHIANGMFGAVIIDPPGLPAVQHEFVLVQSEGYLAEPGTTSDPAKIAAGAADLVMFNGYAMQYRHDPLEVRAGDRVRVWLLDAGPNRGSAFHVVGAQFDTVYREGAYDLRRGSSGSQVLGLFAAQGGFVEFSLPEPGHYPFVTHAMSDAERGASGLLVAR